jgi:hypothetical protein
MGTVLGRESAQGYSPQGVAARHTRPADKPAGPRPDGPDQLRCGLRARAVTRAPHAFAAWSPRAGRRGGVFTDGPPAARCTPIAPVSLRGDAGQGGRGWRVPKRRGGGEAEEGPGTAAFAGGEGAPMGGDGGCGVQRHRCGRGKMKLASIWER